MSDVKVEHKVVMTRAEVAQWIADVGKALSGDGTVSFRLADSTVELKVPDHVRCEAEVEVDGDEIELEFELKWSTAPAAPDVAKKDGAAPKKEPAAARK
jgi:amphi-Trp domain-containing protein